MLLATRACSSRAIRGALLGDREQLAPTSFGGDPVGRLPQLRGQRAARPDGPAGAPRGAGDARAEHQARHLERDPQADGRHRGEAQGQTEPRAPTWRAGGDRVRREEQHELRRDERRRRGPGRDEQHRGAHRESRGQQRRPPSPRKGDGSRGDEDEGQ
jgi:hypothetical protein